MILDFKSSAGIEKLVAFQVDSVAGQTATGVYLEGAFGTLAATDVAGIVQNGTEEGRGFGE